MSMIEYALEFQSNALRNTLKQTQFMQFEFCFFFFIGDIL